MTTQRLPPQPPQVLDLLLSAVSLQGTICHCYEEAGEAQSQGEPLPATQRSSKQIHLACWPQQQTAGDCCPRGSPGPWLRRAKDRHHSNCNNVGPTENGLPMRKPVLGTRHGLGGLQLREEASPAQNFKSHVIRPSCTSFFPCHLVSEVTTVPRSTQKTHEVASLGVSQTPPKVNAVPPSYLQGRPPPHVSTFYTFPPKCSQGQEREGSWH